MLVRLLLPRLRVPGFLHPSPASLFLITLCLAVFFLGAARYQAAQPTVDSHYIAWYNDQDYTLLVTGSLADPPDVRDTYTNLRLQVTGLILARVPSGGDWQYGDVMRLRGHLQTPPTNESFSYQDYLAHQGILAYMPDAEATRLPSTAGNPLLRLVYAFKTFAVGRVYQIFPDRFRRGSRPIHPLGMQLKPWGANPEE